jgi:hypothetical protein
VNSEVALRSTKDFVFLGEDLLQNQNNGKRLSNAKGPNTKLQNPFADLGHRFFKFVD